jgi:protein subunit release factor B
MRKLLFSVEKKDFEITYFSGSGAGGQHRNKHQNCVRLKHRASGAIATGQSNRSRVANTKEALRGITKNGKFRLWHAARVAEVMRGESLEESVEKAMAPQNLRIEARDAAGVWRPCEE